MTDETYEQKLAKLRHDGGGPIRHHPTFKRSAELDYALELRETDPERYAQLSPLQRMAAGFYEQDRERTKPPEPAKPEPGAPGSPEYEALLEERRAWLDTHPHYRDGGNA